MIDHIDNMLRHLLIARITEIADATQVRFQPPDQDWRNYVGTLPGNALNVYLVDLRENRKLRSNERNREINNGIVSETPAPSRIDCHYLITAWSPANPAPAVEPTVDEHALLYSVTGVFMNNGALIPRSVYDPAPLPANFPPEIADEELPTTILPVEGFPKLAEFWGTVDWRWKPGIYLIVTSPVPQETQIAGSMVTTSITEYRQTGKLETAEVWIQIGGHVLDATVVPPVPLNDAWVQLETTAGVPLQSTQTNELGRFTFAKLQPGNYQLRWRAIGRPELPPRTIEVPSSTGEYDLNFV